MMFDIRADLESQYNGDQDYAREAYGSTAEYTTVAQADAEDAMFREMARRGEFADESLNDTDDEPLVLVGRICAALAEGRGGCDCIDCMPF